MILYDFQLKINELLKANKQIKWSVYDFVPEAKRMPFIIIGEDFVTPFNTKTDFGKRIVTTINFWSDQRSMLDMKKMISIVEETLSVDFTLGDFELEYAETDEIDVKRQSEELINGYIKIAYYAMKEV